MRLFTATFAIATLLAATASAYVVRTLPSGAETKWTDSVVPWVIDPAGSDDLSESGLKDALNAAFGTWQKIECQSLKFVSAGTATTTADETVRVRFEEEEWDPAAGGVLAATTNTVSMLTGKVIKSTIEFNGADYSWTNEPGVDGKHDVQEVAIHEIGHALGLVHSRERASAMFYHSPSVNPRALHTDDERAICYLYGKMDFKWGTTCDSCTNDAQCITGTCEFNAVEGASFCATTCTADTSCPKGTTCQGGKCAPEYGFCTETGGTVPITEYCWGATMCETGLFCHTPMANAYCTRICNSTTDCPAAMTCTSGLCALPGVIELGAGCTTHTDCASLECLAPLGGAAYCSTACSEASDCPAAMICKETPAGARCLKAGSGAVGDTCAADADCASLMCADFGRPGGSECTETCATDSCPTGAACIAIGDANLCITPGQITLGGACEAPLGALGCASLTCVDLGAGPVCTQACELGCDSGCECDDSKGLCAAPATAAAEICDGVDQNCNGKADEGFDVGTACVTSDTGCPVGVLACGTDGAAECVQAMDCDDNNPCTQDGCDATGCSNTPLADGASCGTNAACAGVGTCTAGKCIVAPGLGCDDGDPCTIDTCDIVSGCAHTAAAEGTSCSDLNACNGLETCRLGACKAGEPLVCTDTNPCTTATCDPTSGCAAKPVADGVSCADGDACNGVESCNNGACVAGTPMVCDDNNPCNGAENCTDGACVAGPALSCDDDNACTTDTCDVAAGCVHTAVAGGTACADADVCNGPETCQAGTCAPGAALACDDNNPCTKDTCDAVTGCVHTALSDIACGDDDACNGIETCQAGTCVAGTPVHCDDNNLCNGVETCVDGACIAGPAAADGTVCADNNKCNGIETCLAGACHPDFPTVCDDGNPCTTDLCDSATGCSNVAVAEDTPCSDGDVCNGQELCRMGACKAEAPLNCDDGNLCTLDSCDHANGCQHTNLADGAPCEDGDLCNGLEHCVAGGWTAAPPVVCDDNDACTNELCVGTTGCTNTPVSNETACDDGDACNGLETCQGGLCTAGTPIVCDDDDACTTESCDAADGCIYAVAADGTSCSDGDACNGMELCEDGQCTGGTPLECLNSGPCTVASCDAETGCVTEPLDDGHPCDDTNACNGAEACQSGVCKSSAALNCSDGDPCTYDSCDPEIGCVIEPASDGTACPDGNICNGLETCHNGACTAGEDIVCDDGKPCTTDMCDALVGCVTAVKPNGAGCSDGDACNGAELCQAGVCQTGQPLACGDANVCTVDSCDPTVGCVNAPAEDGTECADGDLCNGLEICQAGQCTGTPKVCDDGNPCTTDLCDPLVGCTTQPLEDGAECSDGDICNGVELCSAGECQVAETLNCDDGNPCTVDTCDALAGCDYALADDGMICSVHSRNPCDFNVCVAGLCDGPANRNCNDNNPCTVDLCEPGVGCTNVEGLVCDDGNPCTTDSCTAEAGCANTPLTDGTSCADADACNGAEVCMAGACSAGVTKDCDDGDPCTNDSCDPTTGGCINEFFFGCGDGERDSEGEDELADGEGQPLMDGGTAGDEGAEGGTDSVSYGPGEPIVLVAPPETSNGCSVGKDRHHGFGMMFVVLLMVVQYAILARRRRLREARRRVRINRARDRARQGLGRL